MIVTIASMSDAKLHTKHSAGCQWQARARLAHETQCRMPMASKSPSGTRNTVQDVSGKQESLAHETSCNHWLGSARLAQTNSKHARIIQALQR